MGHKVGYESSRMVPQSSASSTSVIVVASTSSAPTATLNSSQPSSSSLSHPPIVVIERDLSFISMDEGIFAHFPRVSRRTYFMVTD